MNERPFITGTGRLFETVKPGHVYRVEMKNGHRAYAVLPKVGPTIPENPDAPDEPPSRAVVGFSPYDMSRCKILEWR